MKQILGVHLDFRSVPKQCWTNGAVQKDAAVLTPFAACVRMPVPKEQ